MPLAKCYVVAIHNELLEMMDELLETVHRQELAHGSSHSEAHVGQLYRTLFPNLGTTISFYHPPLQIFLAIV